MSALLCIFSLYSGSFAYKERSSSSSNFCLLKKQLKAVVPTPFIPTIAISFFIIFPVLVISCAGTEVNIFDDNSIKIYSEKTQNENKLDVKSQIKTCRLRKKNPEENRSSKDLLDMNKNATDLLKLIAESHNEITTSSVSFPFICNKVFIPALVILLFIKESLVIVLLSLNISAKIFTCSSFILQLSKYICLIVLLFILYISCYKGVITEIQSGYDVSTLFRTVVHAHFCISSYCTGDR
ncbi:MAG: hypothetical protein O7C56_06310 [Rickettsia endosymbiont of Ixodes persulcatus]|nr:hypothetical protein [Rickettsia endosymbiont of Ixodes persulcatus]